MCGGIFSSILVVLLEPNTLCTTAKFVTPCLESKRGAKIHPLMHLRRRNLQAPHGPLPPPPPFRFPFLPPPPHPPIPPLPLGPPIVPSALAPRTIELSDLCFPSLATYVPNKVRIPIQLVFLNRNNDKRKGGYKYRGVVGWGKVLDMITMKSFFGRQQH
jgi:hypothetical protein